MGLPCPVLSSTSTSGSEHSSAAEGQRGPRARGGDHSEQPQQRKAGMDRKPTECGGHTAAPQRNAVHHPLQQEAGCSAPPFGPESRAHTCVHSNLISRAHARGAARLTHLNRGKRLLNEVKSKGPQLSQPQEGAPPPAPSCTSGLNQGAEARQVLQPRSAVYESLRRAPAPLQEFTATSVERADSSRTRHRPEVS